MLPARLWTTLAARIQQTQGGRSQTVSCCIKNAIAFLGSRRYHCINNAALTGVNPPLAINSEILATSHLIVVSVLSLSRRYSRTYCFKSTSMPIISSMVILRASLLRHGSPRSRALCKRYSLTMLFKALSAIKSFASSMIFILTSLSSESTNNFMREQSCSHFYRLLMV